MKIYNLFFSPTGTSRKIATAIADELSAVLNAELLSVDVTTALHDRIEVDADDIVIIAAPVYGGHMAPIARYRMDMIKGNATKCILVAVYGNRAFEHALVDMADFANTHDMKAIAAGAFVGEHSYSTADTPIAVGRPDTADLNIAADFGRRIAARISDVCASEIDATTAQDIPSSEQSLANFKEFVMGYAAKQKSSPAKLLPEVDETICTQCGLCISICPTHAIADDCHTVDPAKCIKCCACVKGCPEGARSLHSPFAPVLSANFSLRKPPVCIL